MDAGQRHAAIAVPTVCDAHYHVGLATPVSKVGEFEFELILVNTATDTKTATDTHVRVRV